MTQRHLLVVDGYGDYLGMRGELLVLKSGNEERCFPFAELESVILSRPHASVSVAALRGLMERGVGLSLLDDRRHDIASLSPRSPHSMALTRHQITWRASGVGAMIAKRCIFDKLRAQRGYARSMLESPTPSRLTTRRRQVIKRALATLERVTGEVRRLTLPDEGYEQTLFTLEAKGAKAWWRAWGAWAPSAYQFEGRRLRGMCHDPLNAALNYGYAILASRLTQMLQGLGFDPHLAVLHADSPKRASLTYDLIERYRQRYVDIPLMRYALSQPTWSLDEEGRLDRATRRAIAGVVLDALDPARPDGVARLRADLESLRSSIFSEALWRPHFARRWSCPR